MATWEEHLASQAEADQLAIALVRSYLDEDDTPYEVLTDQLGEIAAGGASSGLEEVHAALAMLVVQLGTALHGSAPALDEVLAQTQREIAAREALRKPRPTG